MIISQGRHLVLVLFVSSFMSRRTALATTDDVGDPLEFDVPLRFATPVIFPLPESPSTFKRGGHQPSLQVAPHMDTTHDGSLHPLPNTHTHSPHSTPAGSASHQLLTGDLPLDGRSLQPGAFPDSTPTEDSRPGKEPSAKKSHARRQPEGHIPRPRNAFILFRCDFVAQKKIPASVEPNHRNISRIVGRIWKAMSDEDRRPWVEAAKRERERHKRLYPQYRYAPSSLSSSAAVAAPAITGTLTEKRAQNQKIRERMGVLPAWELSSHTGAVDQLSMSQPGQGSQPREATPQAEMQPQTQATASSALWSTPAAQDCGGNVASHTRSVEQQSFAHLHPVSCEPLPQTQQNWSLACSTESQHCPPQGLSTLSASQEMLSFDATAISTHYDSADPSPVRLTPSMPPFLFVASHHATDNPDFSGFQFSPVLGDVSALPLPSADATAYGNDPARHAQPHPHDFKDFEGLAWTDQIDDIIRGMQSGSSSSSSPFNYASQQQNF